MVRMEDPGPMKYVCSMCGTQLRVDKDLDEDRVVEAVISEHRVKTCAGRFEDALTSFSWRSAAKSPPMEA